jgi:hypothetical protein
MSWLCAVHKTKHSLHTVVSIAAIHFFHRIGALFVTKFIPAMNVNWQNEVEELMAMYL